MKYLKKIARISLTIGLYFFAFAGLAFIGTYFAMKHGLTNTPGVIDTQQETFLSGKNTDNVISGSDFTLKNTAEWQIFKDAVKKDKDVIIKAANKADIEPRLIVTNLAVEQMRLFWSSREFYEKVFAPLKILGVQSQFALGVMGIKPDTAIAIEENLKNSSSPFYPGKEYQFLLDFKTGDIATERYNRLTEPHNHYYSYLYASLYLQELLTQWRNAGFDISKKPGIVSTLYNIGFNHSKPNAAPKIGGAEIQIGETTYTFGNLAENFYYSSELEDLFPRQGK